jgi:membrane fusion protein (multidrug efflux system)
MINPPSVTKRLIVRRSLWMALGVILVIGAIAAWKIFTIRAMIAKMATQKPQPTVVSSLKAPEEVWQRRLHAVGSFAAVDGITISNELDGTITQIAFTSGVMVNKGDLLVQLDVSSELAQLASAEASADLARINLKRAKELRTTETNSAADLDVSEAQARQTAANADVIRATIAKKTVRAPFAGRAGIRQVNLGQFIRSGTAIVTLQALDPIYLNFSLPQQDLTGLTVGQAIQVTVDAYPGEVFAGTINALNAKVEDATRNLQVQATLRNGDEKLRSGMFATVDVLLPQKDTFVTLPQTAIVYNPYGNAVYVVEKSTEGTDGGALVARQRFVQMGDTRGDQVAIVKGVKPGEEIVTSGQLKLRNGAAIAINNAVSPANNPAPTPVNN